MDPQAAPSLPVAPAAAPANQPELEAVPSTWPGAFGIYKYSKAAVKFNLGPLLTWLVITIGLGILFGILQTSTGMSKSGNQLVQTIISALVSPAFLILLFAGLDRQKMNIAESFNKGLPLVIKYFFQNILLGVIAVLSIIALVVPFFFIFPRILLAPYFLVRKNMGPIESIQASWNQTKGHVGKVYGMIGFVLLLCLLAVTIIGIPFAIYFGIMYMASFSALYVYIAEGAGATSQPAAAAPAEVPPAV